MATNGASVLKLVEISKPQTIPVLASGLEAEIGEAVASAACAVSVAMEQYRDGGISPAVREAGGERLAKIAMLQLAMAEDFDFSTVAIREGKAVLRRYLDAEPGFRERHGVEGGEKTIAIAVEGVLEIVANVVKFEKVLAAARAN